MIKIIKQGNKNRKTKNIYEHECIMCGCIFEYEIEDTEGGLLREVSIRCPCCNKCLGILIDQEKYRIVEEENENEIH